MTFCLGHNLPLLCNFPKVTHRKCSEIAYLILRRIKGKCLYIAFCPLIPRAFVTFILIVKNFKIVICNVYNYNRYEKCIKMSTNKAMLDPVVLEITCDIFIKQDIFFYLKFR